MAALILMPIMFASCGKSGGADGYVMTSLEYGKIENVVSSTGTIEALGTVNVLSQMTGTVEAIHADFNDRVEKGQGLIDLNTDILAIQTRAAAANVREAAATAEHTRLEYNNKPGSL